LFLKLNFRNLDLRDLLCRQLVVGDHVLHLIRVNADSLADC
jgi:hypothetical protein